MRLLLMAAASLSVPASVLAQPACSLTLADKAANATLSFDDFDQKGTMSSTARALEERGCDREAALATEDYLLNGPPRSDYEQRLLVWHMAQSLAVSGEERQAAQLMTASRGPAGNTERIDWDDYVKASWAFLTKDRTAFDTAAGRLASSNRAADRTNSAIVGGMGRCWAKAYRIAYDADCGK